MSHNTWAMTWIPCNMEPIKTALKGGESRLSSLKLISLFRFPFPFFLHDLDSRALDYSESKRKF